MRVEQDTIDDLLVSRCTFVAAVVRSQVRCSIREIGYLAWSRPLVETAKVLSINANFDAERRTSYASHWRTQAGNDVGDPRIG